MSEKPDWTAVQAAADEARYEHRLAGYEPDPMEPTRAEADADEAGRRHDY